MEKFDRGEEGGLRGGFHGVSGYCYGSGGEGGGVGGRVLWEGERGYYGIEMGEWVWFNEVETSRWRWR